ncbi:T9SS type A sorting domain-containing protein [uncultured Kordia sp.]|uniref:T9SS type A sorting domain-containing protein n=1 Tax=uncultured Kordia sp. TaxID=507699 RepID=UPI0026155EFB|nr:T9SS type A sorting domain-containing protein [uncultured Kordia sp.]
MKKSYLLLLLLTCFTSKVISQITFQENTVDETNNIYISTTFFTNEYMLNSSYAADFDGDGDIDLLPKSQPLFWLENTDGNGSFTTQHPIDNTISRVKDIQMKDVDGDTDLDIVLIGYESMDYLVAWYENTDGQGNFGARQLIGSGLSKESSIVMEDLDGDTDLDIVTAAVSGKIVWYENTDGLGTFGTEQLITNASFSSTTAFIGVVAVDLDGDTDVDILYNTNGSPDSNIYWLENTDGQGTFGTEQLVSDIFGGLLYVKAADLDADGDQDIYGQNTFDGIVSFKNDGSGNFSFGQTIANSIMDFAGVASAYDVDNDSDLDMVVVIRDFEPASAINSNRGAIIWYENTDGQGTYAIEQTLGFIRFSGGDFRFNYNDFNGDNYPDLVFTGVDGYELSWNPYEVSSGTYGNAQGVINDIEDIEEVLSVDIDGDNDDDIVFASNDYDQIAWYENTDGLGNFGEKRIISASSNGIKSLIAVDIDGDTDMDIVSASSFDDKIAWYQNDGSGNFSTEQIVSDVSNNTRILKSADLDGDMDTDLVAVDIINKRIVWYENINGLGSFSAAQIISDGLNNVYVMIVADIDTDGDADIIINSPFSWYENDGQGAFSTPQIIVPNNPMKYIVALDFEGDSDIDLVGANSNGIIRKYENTDGQGTFSEMEVIVEAPLTRSLEVIDIDGDNDMDIVGSFLSGVNQEEVRIFKNYNGTFTFPNLIADQMTLSDITTGDFDGNGTMDILFSENHPSTGEGKIAWLANLGVLENHISGTVTYDYNNDGCDINDYPVTNLLVNSSVNNAFFTTFTDANGTFEIAVSEGNVSTTASIGLPDYFVATPVTHTTSFNGSSNTDDTANFCITATNQADDLNVVLYPLSETRPGFDTSYELVYSNIGTQPASGTVTLVFDAAMMNFIMASTSPDTQTGDTLTFNFSDLLPFETRTITINTNILPPPTTNIGELLTTTVSINPTTSDATPDNNTFELVQTLIGSYDPNDIVVLEGDEITVDQADDYLHYIIRFQNVGTASAINVRVENIIDQGLDLTTLQVESMSHNGRIDILDGIQTVFTFENINLASSTINEPESHGYIAYKIKPRPNSSVGTIFRNSASIFFDFNLPIITNTVTTEIVISLSTEDFEAAIFQIYPNPSNDVVYVNSQFPIKNISITDINGRIIKTYQPTTINTRIELSIATLKDGLYFLNINSNQGSTVKKIIKK